MTSKIEEAFKLKANFLPITVIKFIRLDPRNVLQQLKEIQLSAPNYFHQSPVVIDLSQFKRSVKNLDLAQLTQLLRENDLIPVGVQGLLPEEEILAQELGLALWRGSAAATISGQRELILGDGGSKGENCNSPSSFRPERTKNLSNKAVVLPPKRVNTIIAKPVRSGTRVYAKQSNLVLLSPVSSGAECIADGDIFCYAPVRGRMLAGANGDLQAQIFCQTLESELISIAGYYLLYDEYPEEKNGLFQIILKDNRVHIINSLLERSVSCPR
jgi:septum site-determining protein MinC